MQNIFVCSLVLPTTKGTSICLEKQSRELRPLTKEIYKEESKINQLTIVKSYRTPLVFLLVQVSADQSSHWMKTAETSSAEWGVFSNVNKIMAWVGHCLLYSLLYISPCLQQYNSQLQVLFSPCHI